MEWYALLHPMKQTKIMFTVDQEDGKRVRLAAEREDRSVAAYCRRAVLEKVYDKTEVSPPRRKAT